MKELKKKIRLNLSAGLVPGAHSASNRNEYQKQKNNVSREERERPVRRAENLAANCESIV
jgi:hypothetical protein